MNLPGMISGSVRNTFPHLPPSATRRVENSVDQFGSIGKFGTLDHVGYLDRFDNVNDSMGRIIGHVNQFGNIEPR